MTFQEFPGIIYYYYYYYHFFKDNFFIMKKYEQILSMDKKCRIDMVKNFNEKLQVYDYMRNVIVDDAEKENVGNIWMYGS